MPDLSRAEDDSSTTWYSLAVGAPPAERRSGTTFRASTPDDSSTAASIAIAVKRPITVFFRCGGAFLCFASDGAMADRARRPPGFETDGLTEREAGGRRGGPTRAHDEGSLSFDGDALQEVRERVYV